MFTDTYKSRYFPNLFAIFPPEMIDIDILRPYNIPRIGESCKYKEKHMKRILILSDDSFALRKFRRELIATMLGSDMEVTLGIPAGEDAAQLEALGCKLIDIKTEKYNSNREMTAKYRQILNAEKPDVVVTYGLRPNICGGRSCRKKNIPHCANVQNLGQLTHRTLRSLLLLRQYRTALKNTKAVFFENAYSAAFFTEKKIVREDQQVILPGAGVNLWQHALQPYPEHDTVRFLYLGRMKQEKGTDELLSAIKMLYDDCYEVRLDLVGEADAAYDDRLAPLKEMGIVVVHGFREDPRPYYAACDCVVMPSHSEGMNNVLLEAAATGRPVIGSYIPGCREAVDEGRTGFTFRTQDKYALYEAMRRMAAMPRAQREEMGLAGRQRMEKLFDRQIVVENTMNAIFRP